MADPSIQPAAEDTDRLAQQLWEEAGRPEGQFEEYRTRAEVRLRQQAQSSYPNDAAPPGGAETSGSSGEELS